MVWSFVWFAAMPDEGPRYFSLLTEEQHAPISSIYVLG